MTPEKRKRGTKINENILNDRDIQGPLPELGMDAKARMEALWDLTLEHFAKAGIDGAVGRLDKSVCKVIRPGRDDSQRKPGNRTP